MSDPYQWKEKICAPVEARQRGHSQRGRQSVEMPGRGVNRGNSINAIKSINTRKTAQCLTLSPVECFKNGLFTSSLVGVCRLVAWGFFSFSSFHSLYRNYTLPEFSPSTMPPAFAIASLSSWVSLVVGYVRFDRCEEAQRKEKLATVMLPLTAAIGGRHGL